MKDYLNTIHIRNIPREQAVKELTKNYGLDRETSSELYEQWRGNYLKCHTL